MVKTLSAAELRSLPSAVDLVTAGRAFGIGRTKSHELARAGEFPAPVLRLGNSYRVTRADLLRALGENPDKLAGDRTTATDLDPPLIQASLRPGVDPGQGGTPARPDGGSRRGRVS